MDPTQDPNSDQTSPPAAADYYKDTMFEKPLTPSDVGKLNRLVIPKHHAERHFPLGGEDSAAGMQLGFEDEGGQCWWFRYSYWSSSQSYVLTKGWRRYVKEKRLHAGDVVLFERHRSQPERFFISWRPREAAPPPAHLVGLPGYQQHWHSTNTGEGGAKEGEKATGVTSHCSINNNSNTRLVRLFGVNLEYKRNDVVQAEDDLP